MSVLGVIVNGLLDAVSLKAKHKTKQSEAHKGVRVDLCCTVD